MGNKGFRKTAIVYLGSYLLMANLLSCGSTGTLLENGLSKKEIENVWKEGIKYNNEKVPVINEIMDFHTRPGRSLAYLLKEKTSIRFTDN